MIGWGIWYIFTHPEELATIRDLSSGWLFLLFVLSTVKLISMGVFTKIIVTAFDIKLGFREWFGLSAMSAMGNYLTPFRGGAAVRAVYLKSRHNLSYSSFLSTLSALYVLTFSTSAMLGLLATLGLYLQFDILETTLLVFFSILLCLPIVLLLSTRIVPSLETCSEKLETANTSVANWRKKLFLHTSLRLTQVLTRILEGWRIISNHRGVPFWLILVSVSNACATLMMIHFSLAAFHIDLPLIESLVLSSLFMVSSMIPITPSGLGIAEAAIILAAQEFVTDNTLTGLSVGLNRSIMILSSIVWGALFSHALGHQHNTPSGDHPRNPITKLAP